MVVHNPNNWHWVDKNCIDWARKYFEEKLVGLDTGNSEDCNGVYVLISKINSIEGDCEVNQRKGKLISLFDLKITLAIEGHVNDGQHDFTGSITIPEVAFDSKPEDYQFQTTVYKRAGHFSPVHGIVNDKLVPQLREIFKSFGKELMRVHGGDIQVPEDQVQSTFTRANQKATTATSASSPRPSVQTSSAASPSTPTTVSTNTCSTTSNTTSIHLEPAFSAPAPVLHATLLNKQRVAAWSRAPVQSDNPQNPDITVGETVRLFGGSIECMLKEEFPAQRLVFLWKISDWDQMSTLQIDFHESKEYHETKMVISWSGIPIGQEDRARANFEEYYVKSMKLTFGFGMVL